MQINKTTNYALRILYYLGRENRIVSSSEMSTNMKISQRYLLRIAKDLKSHGYISAGMGSEGGYSLVMPLSDITLYEVIAAMEGHIVLSRCLLNEVHCDGIPCILHEAYGFLQSILEEYLQNLSLDMLIHLPINDWLTVIMKKLYEMYCQRIGSIPPKNEKPKFQSNELSKPSSGFVQRNAHYTFVRRAACHLGFRRK